ncbi:hypothetical protein [Duganella sp. Root1480D1]|uniref:hypothetical protein n=1 Tax=Duganella sp. Root1480D1 TaxID=1736471 RepID=UPI00070EFADC|nr:hypothetical protein [Duganella sp. Root1480D1]KQZ42607.1 hypothetical protein ASD58_24950 [Duganella sp. Root1480D1]
MKLLRSGFLLFAALLCGIAKASPESDFWTWFQKSDNMLFDFETDQEAVFDQLAAKMHQVDARLTFEFGPKKQGRREFVISADGNRDAFPMVEKLYAAAPHLARWNVIKFRPRREPFDISYGGVTVKAQTVSAFVRRDGGKAAIAVLIPGYTKARHNEYAMIAFLLLDQALGEYDVETRIGGVDVTAPSARYPKTTPLKDLPKSVDAVLAH